MRVLLCLAAIGMAISLCGCFKYSQEIWINKDYSARIVTDFGLASQVSALSSLGGNDPLAELRQSYEKSKAELANDKNIRIIDLTESEDEDYHYFKLDTSFRDITKLGASGQMLGPRRNAAGVGTSEDAPAIEYTREKGGKLRFHMALSRMAFKPGGDSGVFGGMGQAMALSMLSGRYFTLTLHAPKILETNGALSEDKRTATWKYSLASLISGDAPPDDVEAVIAMPNLWLPVLLVAIVVVMLAVVILALLAILRRRRRAEPAPAPPEPPAPA